MRVRCYAIFVTRDVSPIAPTVPPELQRRFSVDDYHRMIHAGIVSEDDRVQLLDGVLVEMSPQNERHARLIQRLNRILVRALSDEYLVRPQLPLTLGAQSEPEPDLAVVRAADATSSDEHPRKAILVIEVSADSLRVDRTLKASIYAAAGIPEYWIVNVEARSVEVHYDPDVAAGRYRQAAIAEASSALTSRSLPVLAIAVSSLFD
jgi:Uma2 family endonuclease